MLILNKALAYNMRILTSEKKVLVNFIDKTGRVASGHINMTSGHNYDHSQKMVIFWSYFQQRS